MHKQDISRRIKAVITDWTGETPHDDARLIADMGFDSLDLIDLAMRLEEEFHVEIPDTEWEGAGDKRVCDLTDLVSARLAAKEAA